MSKNGRKAEAEYTEPRSTKPFVLPPGCYYALLSGWKIAELTCEEGMGVQVLTGPNGSPVVKWAENIGENEVCWVVR